MPVYPYRCENCGFQFDKYQKFTEQPLTRCPECGKKTLRKVFSPVGIVFKGSGFYSTDNRSPSGASRAGSARSGDHEKGSNEPASEGKTTPESKPDTPSTSKKTDSE